ncbi:thioesterase [Pseudoalteromonas sp. MMG013]|uniref:thioesterase II family protein n=1 Tax=unclassified Pseudoalteromonas TaxID=194690 RepID=UPI001B393339|nr:MULTISPECIES: thioesterase domain-containing protein [unclassified Pseudoalteromonas]MBQ4844007.1 thioesterase [Pseudoalteromonas sp. MMG005]MBQ4861089.1 thioesterase [Pseudoalteromonas sp. MMG013]
MMNNEDIWFLQRKQSKPVKQNLFCFPYAGGSGQMYLDWDDKVPDGCQVFGVEFPGRGRRFSDPLQANITDLVDMLYANIKSKLTRPFSFYGHSNGALVAYELAKKISRELGLTPKNLFISAKVAPQLGTEYPLHKLSEDEFIEVLKDYKGTPELVFNNPELLEVYTPILRSDFALSENYKFVEQGKLNTDIVILAGEDDEVVEPDNVFAWQALFNGKVRKELMRGDHFFVHSEETALINIINSEL